MRHRPPLLQRYEVGGAPVLVLEDHRLPIVRFVVALRNGAWLDPVGGAGTTRLLLDMLQRGTKRRSREAFSTELERLGSSIDVVVGSETAYLGGAALARHLPQTTDLLAEALSEPAFREEELTALAAEASGSLRAARDDDDELASLFLRRALYRGHPFGRSPLGELTDLETISPQDLRAAHTERLHRRELIFLFAGDVTLDVIAPHIEALLDRLPTGDPLGIALPQPPQVEGCNVLIVDKPERQQAQLRLAAMGKSGHDPAVHALWLGVTAFGGTFTSRFCREVRDDRGWSYVAHAVFDRRGLAVAPVVLHSAPSLSDAPACLALERALYCDLARGVFEAGSVDLAREYLVNREPLALATAFAMLGPALKNELLGNGSDEINRVSERLEATTEEDVKNAVRDALSPDRQVVVMVATADAVRDLVQQQVPSATVRVVDFRDGLGFGTEHHEISS